MQLRAVHEATRLLSALADDDDVVRRWLNDDDRKWVRPGNTRNSQEATRARLRETLIVAEQHATAGGDGRQAAELAQALELDVFAEDSSLLAPTRQIYDVLSRIGHSRRSGIRDAVSTDLRQMATGPHSDPFIRAEYVSYGGLLVIEVLSYVGHVLGQFHGPGWFTTQLGRSLTSSKAFRTFGNDMGVDSKRSRRSRRRCPQPLLDEDASSAAAVGTWLSARCCRPTCLW